MVGSKQILCAALLMILSGVAMAQNNTNSPYTRYGYGDLSPQTSGRSRGMGGVAYGLRDGSQVNAVNPASYTMVDSLTFLFDAGVSLQNTNVSDGTTKMNTGNSSFDYVTMQFRLHPRLGMTLGLLPYSNVGYSFLSANTDNPNNLYSITYSGDGGLHQAFIGAGFKILKNLSVGVNASYFWGDITRTTDLFFSSGSKYNYRRTNGLSVNDFKFDVGVQYTQKIDKKNEVTIGATFSPRNSLNNDAYRQTYTYLSDYSEYNLETTEINTTYDLPLSVGVGFAYKRDNRLTIAGDYTYQKWSNAAYEGKKFSFYDMNKVALGVEYLPSLIGRSYFSHIKYRLGGYYSTPYYKIQDEATGDFFRASSEYGVTAGFALPLPRTRSQLSISAQYVHVAGKRTMLDEKYMRLSIGITFNERWFFKRKVD